MTAHERDAVGADRAPASAASEVVVLTTSEAQLGLYRSALRMAGVPARLTLDPDEAALIVLSRKPAALVLDADLPRSSVLQLYGVARDDERQPPMPVVFVGQDGTSSGADYFLAGEQSPLAVAAQVSEIIAQEPAAEAPAVAPAPAAAPADSGPAAAPASAESPAAEGAEVPPAATEAAPPAAERDGAAAAPAIATPAAPAGGRRLDVILLRIGIVLLIVGVTLLFLWPGDAPPPANAPTPQPTPVEKPAASPSPAAHVEPGGPLAVVASAG